MIKTDFLFNKDKLLDLIAELMGINRKLVIHADSKADMTNIPFYVVVRARPSTVNGHAVRMDDEEEIERSTIVETAPYSIEIVGNNAVEWARRLCASLRLGVARDRFKKMNVGLMNVGNINNLSLPIEASYEQRARFDIILSQTTTVQAVQQIIRTSEIKMME